MRRRLATIALVLATLSATTLVTEGAASGGVSTRAAGASSETPAPFQGAGLKELLLSLVDGDSPLITEVPPSVPFSPFGDNTNDNSGESSIADEFEFSINLSSYPVSGDVDLDGYIDFSSSGNPDGPAADQPAEVLRVDGSGSNVEKLPWGDNSSFDPLADFPSAGFGNLQLSSLDDLLAEAGLDPEATGTQKLGDTDVQIARPLRPGTADYRLPVVMWGGHTRGSRDSGADCSSSMYLFEMGRAWHRAGALQWAAEDYFPNDLFSDASDAMVIRCDGNWQIDRMVNNGTSFNSTETNTKAIVFPNGFLAFTPAEEFANTIGYRAFSFRTPAVNGFRQDNTIATTFPSFPDLMTPMPTVVVGSPYPSADHGPFPLSLEFTSLDPGTDANPCSGDWSAIFEAYAWDTRTEGVLGASIYQFNSGQVTSGQITYDGSEWDLSTDGSGDGYTEMLELMGPQGAYTYMPDAGECPYSVTVSNGWDELVSALTKFAPAVTTPESTQPPAPSSSAAPSSTPAPTDSTTTSSDTSEGDDGLPWGALSVVAGLVLLVGGYLLTKTRGDDDGDEPTPSPGPTTGPAIAPPTDPEDPCDRLRRMYAAAKAAADKARKAADEAETKANDAEVKAGQADSSAKDADSAAGDAERDRKKAERNRKAPDPSESESWIEDSETGERITGTDLRLRREAAGDAWKGYHDNPSADSAAETEDQWSHLDDEGARAKRRTDWEADQAKRAKAVADAEAKEKAAKSALDKANEARDAADKAAKNARAEADRLEGEAAKAEARAAALKKDLDECLGLKSGPSTRWGGPVGIGEDPDGGCFPEGNVERRVLDSFNQTVRVDIWVTVRPSSTSHLEAERIAGEIEWWQHIFGTASAALNVKGAFEGLVTRTVGAALSTAESGATVIAGDSPSIGIDIPTVGEQVPVVILEGLAATTKTIIRSFGGWIKNNHIETIAEFGFQQRDVELTWVEIWKCQNGVKTCVERVLEIKMGEVKNSGTRRREVFQPRENWEPRVQGYARTFAHQARDSSKLMIDFMQEHKAGPCGG